MGIIMLKGEVFSPLSAKSPSRLQLVFANRTKTPNLQKNPKNGAACD